MKSIYQSFWRWYERHYELNLLISSLLFLLQIVHLYWLATHVIMFKLTGQDFFFAETTKLSTAIFSIVDYTEIPALIGVTLIYLNDIRINHRPTRAWLYVAFLNVQWIHLFWLTDEIVIKNFTGVAPINFHPVAAWIAIMIDYLEVPVIFGTLLKLRTVGLKAVLERD